MSFGVLNLKNPSQNPDLELHEIYTVSQLNTEARILLEQTFQQIWIMGELSNLSRPSSGHIYFSLKDQKSQIRCALFRNNNHKLKFKPENGQQVLALAFVSMYEPRGDFQLIVVHMEVAGSGALQIAFEKLKKQLAEEGLFDEKHKQPLPSFPRQIGVITSSTGAAIQDILTVLKRRFASIPVIVYHTLVQGDKAAPQIAAMIKIANQRNECDVLILARGGGSLEDLWPFNEEIVARAIFASVIPIVSGVGHEIDFTIADFVADLRAPTPSAAAESITPDKIEWQKTLLKLGRLLQQSFSSQIQQYKNHLLHLSKRLRHPGQRLRDQAQRLDQLEQSLMLALKNKLTAKRTQLEHSITKLHAKNPTQKIDFLQHRLQTIQQKMIATLQYRLKSDRQRCAHLATALDTLSPLKTLERGYAILTDKLTQKIIRKSSEAKIGECIIATLANGKLGCIVQEKIEEEKV